MNCCQTLLCKRCAAYRTLRPCLFCDRS